MIHTVFPGLLVSICMWGGSHPRLSWWAGYTTFRPPTAEIYEWEWWGITCIILSRNWSLESTARSAKMKCVDIRRVIIPWNCRNCLRQYCGRYRLLYSTSMCGSPTPSYHISPYFQWGWAGNWGSRPIMNIWSMLISLCFRRDQDTV